MDAPVQLLLESALVLPAVLVALWLRPWRVLRATHLQHPWLAAMVVLPWVWSLHAAMPGGTLLQMSGACLLVLMFGWPLAVVSLPPIAALGAWLGGLDAGLSLGLLTWNGIVPATLALGVGWATRRWLPQHLFVYILARSFLGTAVALSAASIAGLLWQGGPETLSFGDMVIGHWLMAWGEAVATGMLTAVFVAFRPDWLLTYSDRLYLPDDRRKR
ncbi:energy-coupling factor ABC transporter permease [Caldimonas tepidiphila]|uniref:energy-coupling factor ABC transporter permease n=1 Tax=Caldimonas tepidiphila TaxID=2315841 RepID=UPI001F0C90B9|nr:energy-coupling factor ABC transporter permease [Caldimonas tepidiphila]